MSINYRNDRKPVVEAEEIRRSGLKLDTFYHRLNRLPKGTPMDEETVTNLLRPAGSLPLTKTYSMDQVYQIMLNNGGWMSIGKIARTCGMGMGTDRTLRFVRQLVADGRCVVDPGKLTFYKAVADHR